MKASPSTLKTPPWLLGATLLFWGWLTGLPAIGAIMGIALEASRWIKRRWDFTADEFNQLWNITALLFLGAAAYVFAANDGLGAVTGMLGSSSFNDRNNALDKASQTVLVFLRWMPMIFFPFTAAQAYSSTDLIDLKTFSWLLRRRAKKSPAPVAPASGKRGVNTASPYFAICVVAASATHGEPVVFYAGMCLLMAWGLWSARSPRYSAPVWAFLMAGTAALGFAGALGLQNAQRAVELLQARWLNNMGQGRFDARETHTAIGQIGRMKDSGQILLRLEVPPGSKPPSLLREAAYETYRWPAWTASGAKSAFAQLAPETNETSWVFLNIPPTYSVIVSTYLPGGQGLLPMPHGSTRLDRLPVIDFKTNQLGTAKVDSGPGLVVYTARWAENVSMDSRPNTNLDLAIPESEAPALAQIASELHLAAMPETDRVRAIERYFAQNFSYSLYQKTDAASQTNEAIRTPLAYFLLKRKAGHCEYFATATTLLLRQAGIPARYTAGYAVQEKGRGNRYVVRSRHAHAWCLYYDRAGGLWRELDTTPGNWADMEREHKSFLEPVRDAFSWVWFQFSLLRWGQGNLRQHLFQLVAVLVVLLIIRFVWTKRWKTKGAAAGVAELSLAQNGLDSEFFLVEKKLAKLGLSRRVGEPFCLWLDRIRPSLPIDYRETSELIALHYRLRFDPRGLSPEDRTDLRRRALALLKHADAATTPKR
jgi:transglutaminase-like putative cysteine protease